MKWKEKSTNFLSIFTLFQTTTNPKTKKTILEFSATNARIPVPDFATSASHVRTTISATTASSKANILFTTWFAYHSLKMPGLSTSSGVFKKSSILHLIIVLAAEVLILRRVQIIWMWRKNPLKVPSLSMMSTADRCQFPQQFMISFCACPVTLILLANGVKCTA